MANITKAIIKATTDAGSKAITKGAQKAVGKATTKAIEKATTKAITNATEKAVNRAITKGLTGAGVSSLAPKAGSTLDGILGRSSGIVLPNAEKPKAVNLSEKYANTPLAKTAKQELAEIADRNTKLVTDLADDPDNMWFSDAELNGTTVGKLYPGNAKNRIGSTPDTIIPADKPEIAKMIKDGKLKVAHGTDREGYSKLKNYELTGKPLAYEEKNSLLEAIKDALPEEDAEGLALEAEDTISPDQLRLIDQDTTPREMKIEVEKPRTRKKSIDVALGTKEAKLEKPIADMGVEDAVSETPVTTNPELASQIADLRSQIGSTGGSGAGMGNNGGGGMATDLPGSEGFNVKLKEGKTYNIQTSAKPSGATPKQRGLRGVEDRAAKALNANARQYRDLLARSKSVGDIYHSPAERAYVEGVTLNNVRDKTEAVLSRMEGLKNEALSRAEANGVMIDLSGMDKLVGLSPTQKRKLAELGLDLDADILQGGRLITPTQAEEVYKTLRDYAYKWGDSSDPVTTLAGKAMKKEADAISKILDQKMNDLGFDFKVSYINEMGRGGADLSDKYLRRINDLPKFDFSDLRREEADWITIGKTMGNKPAKEPTLNVFGVDTGIKNPFTAGADKIKEKFYERQAYGPGGFGGAGGNMGGGAGNNMGGGTVPPTGGSGAENSINFETVGGGGNGTLSKLLGKAKSAGLVGAGILGGLALGGGGGGSNDGSNDFTSMSYNPYTETEPEIDPYSEITLGGYTYDQLEAGYMAAMQAGDSDAAKLIANMISMLDDKIERYNSAKEKSSDSSGIASKQRAALNVLSGLMQNYSAQGPIGGRFTGFMNALTGGGYNPEVAAYDSGAQGSLGTIIKALGDTGALSEGDQRRALELLPKTTDSEEAAKYKYQQLIQILQGAGAQ